MLEIAPITVRARAPLRLGLAGGGTDVSPYSDIFGGFVLNATIDMHAYCTIEITNNGYTEFYAADIDQHFKSPTQDFFRIDGELNIYKGIYNKIIKDYIKHPLSLKMTTYSDAPPGSGLGSSSTMVVAIIKAYTEALNLPLGEYDIANFAYEVERVDLGMTGGKQDHYAAAFGGLNFIEFYAENRVIVNPLRIKDWIINELENSMILYYTGISRESANIIDEQIKNVKEKNQISIDAMHQLKRDALSMKEAILKGEFCKFAKYLNGSWEAKKQTASSITNDYINNVYKTAMDAGAKAGKVSGAGGGGFIMFLVDPVKKLKIIESLRNKGGQVYNFHFTKEGAQAWKV